MKRLTSIGLIELSPAIRALRACKKRINSYEEARAIKGVGEKTAQKVIKLVVFTVRTLC